MGNETDLDRYKKAIGIYQTIEKNTESPPTGFEISGWSVQFWDNDNIQRPKKLCLSNGHYRASTIHKILDNQHIESIYLNNINVYAHEHKDNKIIHLPFLKSLVLDNSVSILKTTLEINSLEVMTIKNYRGLLTCEEITDTQTCPRVKTVKLINSNICALIPFKNAESVIWSSKSFNIIGYNLYFPDVKTITIDQDRTNFGTVFSKFSKLFPKVRQITITSKCLGLMASNYYNNHKFSLLELDKMDQLDQNLWNLSKVIVDAEIVSPLMRRALELELSQYLSWSEIVYEKSTRVTPKNSDLVKKIEKIIDSPFLNLDPTIVNKLVVLCLGYCSSATGHTVSRMEQFYQHLKSNIELHPQMVEDRIVEIRDRTMFLLELYESLYDTVDHPIVRRLKTNIDNMLLNVTPHLIQCIDDDIQELITKLRESNYPNIELLLDKNSWHNEDFIRVDEMDIEEDVIYFD
jgi:hypothetical protein